MNKIIKEQLERVTSADLSHFDENTNSYFIPKKTTIKLEVDQSYVIHLKSQAFTNDAVIINWNQGKKPVGPYMMIEVLSLMPGMMKIVGVNQNSPEDTTNKGFWSGWLNINDVDVLKKL